VVIPKRFAVFVLVAALLAARSGVASANEAKSKRPNIVVVLADDLGYSDLGCYGSEIKTPVLDDLAKHGLRFTQFYNTPRCCPTRAALLTGLYPHLAGMGSMEGNGKRPGYQGSLQGNCATLAQLLRGTGYRTLMIGKWHLGRPGPIARGFDEYYGMLHGFDSFWDPKTLTRLPADRPQRTYAEGKFYATDAMTDHALDFLAEARREAGKPFLLYLAYTAPHFPLHAPREEIAKYADVYRAGWDRLREERHARMKQLGVVKAEWPLSPRSGAAGYQGKGMWRQNPPWDSLDADRREDLARRMAIYAAMVDRMDQNLGRVVAYLRQHGELDNTLLLFLSDNGASAEWDAFGFDHRSGPENVLHKGPELDRMGGPGTYHSYGSGWGDVGNTPFRLYKHYCHEGGVSTPLIVHWPARIHDRGAWRNQVGHVIDIVPTCLEVAAGSYPAELEGNRLSPLEGKSLVPAFSDRPVEREALYWEHEGNRAIRQGKWTLVAKGPAGAWELYDIEADRTELHDRAGADPERVRQMALLWEAWARRCHVVPWPWTPPYQPVAAK
jgi:arylsulfatase A-like enzyme